MPAEEYDKPILINDLPELVVPIAHYVHEHGPERIIAVDRGARLGALALFVVYKKLYHARIPTVSHKIDFLRFSKDEDTVDALSGRLKHIIPCRQNLHDRRIKLLIMDDWVDSGRTSTAFIEAAESIGLDKKNIALATLCGVRRQDVQHVIGDPSNTTTNSLWNGYEDIIGVTAGSDELSVWPHLSNESHEARIKLYDAINTLMNNGYNEKAK